MQEKDKQKEDEKLSQVNKAGFFKSFIQKKIRGLNQKNQANKSLKQSKCIVAMQPQHQVLQRKNNQLPQGDKKGINENEQQNTCIKDLQLIKKGKILRVIGQNLVPDQFRVEVVYQHEIYQLTATKYQIQQNNVRVLLDWYQTQLQLNDEDIRI